MAAASATQEPQAIRPQRRRIRADSVFKDEAHLQEDAALAASLNTALPGRLEDDRELAATQEDEEEDEEDEGEEEEPRRWPRARRRWPLLLKRVSNSREM